MAIVDEIDQFDLDMAHATCRDVRTGAVSEYAEPALTPRNLKVIVDKLNELIREHNRSQQPELLGQGE